MDSLTQAALGGTIAGVCAPAAQRRRALIAGALLGTLPDLDVLIDYGDPVANMTYHRGFSHSLIVLLPFSFLVWLALRRVWAPVRAAPGRWCAAIVITLTTHPLLDAHTVYGTQLLWPFAPPPAMWSTLFIIDPLYSLPLLGTVSFALARPAARRAGPALVAGLALSTAYLGWSWLAKGIVEREAERALAPLGLAHAPRFSVPTPLNTLLWRVVVLTDQGYAEGLRSLFDGDAPMRFSHHPSQAAALAAASDIWAVSRLRWFTHDFLAVRVHGEHLILSDLRMGQTPDFVFSHVVARCAGDTWQRMEPERIVGLLDWEDLTLLWHRLRDDTAAALPAATQVPPGSRCEGAQAPLSGGRPR